MEIKTCLSCKNLLFSNIRKISFKLHNFTLIQQILYMYIFHFLLKYIHILWSFFLITFASSSSIFNRNVGSSNNDKHMFRNCQKVYNRHKLSCKGVVKEKWSRIFNQMHRNLEILNYHFLNPVDHAGNRHPNQVDILNALLAHVLALVWKLTASMYSRVAYFRSVRYDYTRRWVALRFE